ncbi:long-chain fatty acid--CoA ligase [Kineobactrum sediminis]|uniref:Long-chain fatty acid--CoA ligase n=1 Tax=Kineobactrum sediminis TaxID=1905677 RepID=A0A2N5Y5C9_9GAMM|nr:class I adenylate-forming enzyme family protein [Kineobactrum sediminis]PLW83572.1 long-chain fatty acid--CoA ligase [Kineobactrum sediminis]
MAGFEAPVPLLPEILALHGKWRARKPALICGDHHLDWAAFCAANHTFAHGLLARGVMAGDRVGIVMSNGAPMVQAIFGSMAAGAVSVPVNLSVSDDALVGMLEDAEIRVLVVSTDQWARLQGLLSRMPASLTLRVTSGPAEPGWLGLAELCRDQPNTLPDLRLAADAALNIIYSSGTTGLPKGILHSHRTRRDWAYDLAIALRYTSGARTLLTLGLYSNISWVAMLCTVLAGGTLVVHSKFDAGDFLETVARERITHTAMVPIQYQRVIERLAREHSDVSSMQGMMSCGSPLHEGLKREIFSRFPCGIIELYGLTEGIITTLDPEDAPGRWGSVGQPLIGTDLCIIDDQDKVLGPSETGEIVSRGRISMPGYWHREDANREAEFIDEQGRQWLRSGDLGYIDEDGFLYIVDRKKDMILSGGQNIYPQDIEAVLVQHPAVDDVAVIGVNSKRWGETPLGLVVPVANAKETTADLLAWANERLGRQQRLVAVNFVSGLPRNPNGKILKRELREQYREADDG